MHNFMATARCIATHKLLVYFIRAAGLAGLVFPCQLLYHIASSGCLASARVVQYQPNSCQWSEVRSLRTHILDCQHSLCWLMLTHSPTSWLHLPTLSQHAPYAPNAAAICRYHVCTQLAACCILSCFCVHLNWLPTILSAGSCVRSMQFVC